MTKIDIKMSNSDFNDRLIRLLKKEVVKKNGGKSLELIAA